MSQETDWQDQKVRVQADLDALLALGVPLELARKLAGWNPTLGYVNFSDVSGPGSFTPSAPIGLRNSLRLLYSRSTARVNPFSLDGSVLDAGKEYAVFIPDVPELLISKIEFFLNGVAQHTEFSTPWDYAGTAGGGGANRVTFIAGTYTIAANVSDFPGSTSLEATFTVE